MREILFRGKRIDNGKWVYGYYIFANSDSKMLIDRTSSKPSEWVYENVSINNHLIAVFTPPDTQGWDYGTQLKFYKVDPDTIGQFTGLLDKNGNKIFEGDRLLATYNENHKFNCVVKYDLEEMMFALYQYWENIDKWETLSNYTSKYTLQVIGNIHEGGEQ